MSSASWAATPQIVGHEVWQCKATTQVPKIALLPNPSSLMYDANHHSPVRIASRDPELAYIHDPRLCAHLWLLAAAQSSNLARRAVRAHQQAAPRTTRRVQGQEALQAAAEQWRTTGGYRAAQHGVALPCFWAAGSGAGLQASCRHPCWPTAGSQGCLPGLLPRWIAQSNIGVLPSSWPARAAGLAEACRDTRANQVL